MKQTLVIKYIGDDKETVIPFIGMDDENSTEDRLVLIKPDSHLIFVYTNNCKYFYFREEETK